MSERPPIDLHASPGTRRGLLLASLACLGVLAITAFFDRDHAIRAYLTGWLVCLAAALGAMAWVMIHHLTGGRWGWLTRRPGEALAATLPAIAIAFLPIALGARHVFPWADADAVAHSVLLRHRNIAFAPALTIGRAFVFLAIWCAIGWLLRRLSLAHDRDGDERSLARLATLSAAGLVAYFVTMSLASVDWIASREVDWYSSTFGVMTVLGQAATGMAALIVCVWMLRRSVGYREIQSDRATHDLGNLLQTSVVLWAYVSFMQYLVIWTGNSQEDNRWFVHRNNGGWVFVGIAIIVLHFGLPFVMLLMQGIKRDLTKLAMVAVGVFAMRIVDTVWTIVPSGERAEANTLHWVDPFGIAGLVGLWAWWSMRQLESRPLVPRARELAVGPVPAEGGGHVPA